MGAARDEIARLGLRHRAPTELTESERRIAELAAAGMTNRQVAEASFVSPKTVEANLARVYQKLGIRSRAELGARMSATSGDAETKRRESPDVSATDRAIASYSMSDQTTPVARQTYLVEHYRPGSPPLTSNNLRRECGRRSMSSHAKADACDSDIRPSWQQTSRSSASSRRRPRSSRLAYDRASVTFERISAAHTEQS